MSAYSDEEIHRLLLQAIADQKQPDAAPASKPAPQQAKPRADAAIERDLSIEEILKKLESEIAEKKPAAARQVNPRR